MEFKASSPLPPTSQTLNNPVTTNRPIIHPNTDRYVWCGTKDGQLFEFDCWERRVTDSKSSLHSSAVIGVYRCKSGGMCTLDDSSKVQIWSSPGQIRISSPARAQRIIDKINFSEMISHQLWVSSGPSSSKSSSNASQRSPTIRVYDPDPSQAWTVTPRALKVPDSMGTALGQVMAGTVIPSKPNRVYLGHDTGHVSVWLTNQTPSISSTTSNLAPSSSGLTRRPSIAINKNLNSGSIAFKRLLKLSNYQITAMVGVTKYLWVGFKTGNVYVYETDDGETQRNEAEEVEGYSRRNSWKVLKVWRAHKESILKIFVDPSGLWDEEVGKLHVATTSTDWKVKLWDGTMSVDWLSTEMKRREPEYCTYRTIKTLICSWNVDACKPQELVGTKDNLNFLEDVLKSGCNGGDTSTRPDVLVFGFQEMIDLENKKLTAKTVLLGSRKKGVEKLPDSVSLTYRKWHDRLVSAVRMTMPVDDPYVVIHTENLVGLFTCVFVKSSERDKMRDIAITTVKTGMKGRYGNKGAILARFVVDDSSVCFINCHLAAGQKNVRQRNEDLIDILEEKSGFPDPTIEMNATTGVFVGGGNGSSILDHEICFLQGDLNYRIDCRREDVIRAISAGESFKLLEFDQLIKEKLNNPSFRLRSFYEPPIRFHPTYKYDRGTHMYDSSEKNRTPAWCDRILYRTPQESLKSNYELVNSNNNGVGGFSINGTTVETLDYRRYEVNVSDHRPISGTYLLRVKSIVPGLRRKVWEEVKARWNDYESEVIANAKGYYRNF
ncbi:Endonuclease/exonuclease/phosphatase [Phakopsora pachyrhizi]|uniref:Endonuclease/exonuclease/phosphatase n=1 Tax=Phakopsora pachyrhizi TaxID=170000 RepID=A0AAV0AD52_PHAPC|nr:Endonuclease/exonuclease/phosphatase [Phakopsora pachyrhizi]CAH7665925.1 Endonuclease/exonuclease/phosphatase [Phakopsora pachyrhizi]